MSIQVRSLFLSIQQKHSQKNLGLHFLNLQLIFYYIFKGQSQSNNKSYLTLTKKIEKEVLKIYDIWLHSYLNGDVQTYDNYLDDAYHFIGPTNNEEFLSRKDTTQFFAETADQLAGKTKLRNETKTFEQFGELIIITHFFDAWILQEKEWVYFSRFRFSSTLIKRTAGWRFIYQHFSIPDSRVEDGETIGFDKINEENKELREAIQRRTFELEAKNRELEVEGSLARIRAEAVAMKESSDLLDIVVTMRNEFIKLGHEAHYFWHMMWLPEKYEKAMTSGDGTRIGFVMELPRHIHGNIPLLADWEKGEDPIVIYPMNTEAAIDYVDKMIALGDFQNIDPQAPSHEDITHIGGLTFIMARTSHGEIGYSLPGIVKNPPKEALEILERFANTFDLAHRRFLDLQKAEAQAQEAKIEASLEKVRTVALTLNKSDDMLDIAQVLFEQLLELGFSEIRNAIIDIHDDANETFLDYDYSHDMSSAITLFSFYGDPVIEQQIKKVQSANDAFFEIELKGDELKELIETRLRNGEKDDPRLYETEHLTYNLYSFGNGAIGISNFGILSDDQKKILKRFRNVFTFAYKRYTELAKAEAQALEAKIEASLEKVRSVTLGLNNSDDMLLVAKALYEQLLALGFSNIRNSIIDIENDDGVTFLDYDYSHEMGGTVTPMSYKDAPTLKEQLEDISATTDGISEIILEGKQLQDLIEMRRKNGEADDPRLIDTKSLSYILYAFGNGAIGISNFGVLAEHQKTILSRFRNVFTFAYQRYKDIVQSEVQAAALLAEKQRLEVTLSNLQATQKQLIQAEKMASLGELTAGIAHEIQNPLNFVNNFSEVSNELIDEMNEEIEKGDLEEAKLIASDIKQNLEKINHHGKRADAIVKGMLQHSRKSTAEKEPTDINKLADEYLRLAYHGLRAKDKSFNATLVTNFDERIGLINVIPQDMGRVILNLITNAFYACTERLVLREVEVSRKANHEQKNTSEDEEYKPTVTVSTEKLEDQVVISVKDNGIGIPKHVVDKIFQPFFTTKPTGEGTGLGLSMSYDIIKAHGGTLKVETVRGEGSTFFVSIPTKN